MKAMQQSEVMGCTAWGGRCSSSHGANTGRRSRAAGKAKPPTHGRTVRSTRAQVMPAASSSTRTSTDWQDGPSVTTTAGVACARGIEDGQVCGVDLTAKSTARINSTQTASSPGLRQGRPHPTYLWCPPPRAGRTPARGQGPPSCPHPRKSAARGQVWRALTSLPPMRQAPWLCITVESLQTQATHAQHGTMPSKRCIHLTTHMLGLERSARCRDESG